MTIGFTHLISRNEDKKWYEEEAKRCADKMVCSIDDTQLAAHYYEEYTYNVQKAKDYEITKKEKTELFRQVYKIDTTMWKDMTKYDRVFDFTDYIELLQKLDLTIEYAVYAEKRRKGVK